LKRFFVLLAVTLLGAFACSNSNVPTEATEPPQAESWRSAGPYAAWYGEENPPETTGSDVDRQIIRVGEDRDGARSFSFLRFPLKADLLSQEVSGARLFLKIAEGSDAPTNMRIGYVPGLWDAGYTTLADALSMIDENSLEDADVKQEKNGWISLPVTNTVKGWLAGDAPNYGIVLFPGRGAKSVCEFALGDENNVSPYFSVSGAVGNRADDFGKYSYTETPLPGAAEDEGGNCLSYALRDTDMILVDDLGADYEKMNDIYKKSGEDGVAEYVADLAAYYAESHKTELRLSGLRIIDGFDAKIDPKTEYRIALRVGCKVFDGAVDLSANGAFDYHLWVQLSDGRWAQKFPLDPSEIVPGSGPGISPEKYPWDSAVMWYGKTQDYYTSKAVYAAVAKDTNEFTRHKSSPGAQSGVLAVTDMAYELADSSGIKVVKFDLGAGDVKNAAGKPLPAPLAGIIAAPDGPGPHPLVVIVHGVRLVENVYEDLYSGFDYLAKQLAAEGYVALAFNVNLEYKSMEIDGDFSYGESNNYEWAYSIYKQHMSALENANNGKETLHGIDLKGKIDFNNIHMIGHSRGAEVTEGFILLERDEGLSRIKSQIRAEGTLGNNAPDVPLGIILGEFDGEVPEDGQALFDTLQTKTDRKAPASLVYLRGANHAQFNRKFEKDFITDPRVTPENLLPREKQEEFLTRYAAAFLSVYDKGAEPHGIWDPSVPAPSRAFGFPITASYYMPGRRSVAEVSEKSAPTAQGNAAVKFLALKYESELFTHPGIANSYQETGLPLYNVRWKDKGGAVSIPCAITDFSGGKSLSMYTAVDSSYALNQKGEAQSFTITLKDKSGADQSVVIPKGASATSYYEGFVKRLEAEEFAPARDIWVGYMPLGELRIPLNYFDKINLKEVSEITIGLNRTETGSIMISGIYLQ
jgi:dienelactone hydrolase